MLARFAFLLLLFAPIFASAETLTSLSAIRELTPETAATRLPVRIEGVVTFSHTQHGGCVLHDGKVGIVVKLKDAQLKPGDRVRVEGVTGPGNFVPIVEEAAATVLSAGPLPKPRAVSGTGILSPPLDGDWVEFSAMPVAAEKSGDQLVLTLLAQGWRFRALMRDTPGSDARILALMNRPCAIRAVALTVPNQERQMTARYFGIPDFDQIIVKPQTAAAEAPLRTVETLLLSGDTARPVRVRGIVTASTAEGVHIRGEKGAMLVRLASPEQFAPGTEIEAEGFSTAAAYRPELGATRVTATGTAPAPAPRPLPLNFSRKEIAALHAELTVVEAVVLAVRPGEETVISCDAGGEMIFDAVAHGFSPPELRRGDRIRLTGICRASTGTPLLREEVDAFRIITRGPEDFTILARSPWWTLPRVLTALGVVMTLAAGVFAWAWMLRRKVAAQTSIIARQIERDATQTERERIARELHDTVEQELTGIAIQLGNARQHLAATPQRADAALDLAQRMLGHCRREARSSIQDLRSIALQQRGLAGALAELLPTQTADSGPKITIHIAEPAPALDAPAELHLLRIAQEAVANAIRHASASNIEVRLTGTAEKITLEVRDDGCGFDATAEPPRGHFGLRGIRERANKLHGELSIESAPGHGTLLRLRIPATAPAAASL